MNKKNRIVKKEDIKSLYYISHIDNVESILKHGIYSHHKIKSEHIQPNVIYNADVVSIRENKKLPTGDNLTEYANLYFQSRNPMLYRILHDKGEGRADKGIDQIVLLEIKKTILDEPNTYIAQQNAATQSAAFFPPEKGYEKLNRVILDDQAWWNDLVDGKSKIMAEFLVKDHISPDHILSIYTASQEVKEQLDKFKTHYRINVILDKTKFFLPNQVYPISEKIKLVQGDMFFSTAQTLTISVNTVGIMGKGLASRTRYQFPDVFVEYQDLCRYKKIKMGTPYLIKREKSIDEILAYGDLPSPKNNIKWFLLFPTKSHWKYDSDIKGIEEGLQWLVKNYRNEKIQSIALPALGCGLGKLNWCNVGPLMCTYLQKMDIKSTIYLPMEKTISPEQVKKEFLLGSTLC